MLPPVRLFPRAKGWRWRASVRKKRHPECSKEAFLRVTILKLGGPGADSLGLNYAFLCIRFTYCFCRLGFICSRRRRGGTIPIKKLSSARSRGSAPSSPSPLSSPYGLTNSLSHWIPWSLGGLLLFGDRDRGYSVLLFSGYFGVEP